MFFKSLHPLLLQCVGLTIALTAHEGDSVTVIVTPLLGKDDKADAALKTPIKLTGTVDELDNEFAQILASYTEKRGSLLEQLAATATVLDAAKATSAKSATTAAKKASTTPAAKPALTEPSESESNLDEEDDGEVAGGETEAATQTSSGSPAVPALESGNLFA